MDIETQFFKLGIPTYIYSVETTLQGVVNEKIGDTIEVTLGWVYGLSINIEGKIAESNATNNITSVQAYQLFLNLKYGQSIYVNSVRLNHFIFDDPSAVPRYNNPSKYLPVNFPSGTDLKQSFYENPTLITGNVVTLNFFYIDKTSYNRLVKSNTIFGQELS